MFLLSKLFLVGIQFRINFQEKTNFTWHITLPERLEQIAIMIQHISRMQPTRIQQERICRLYRIYAWTAYWPRSFILFFLTKGKAITEVIWRWTVFSNGSGIVKDVAIFSLVLEDTQSQSWFLLYSFFALLDLFSIWKCLRSVSEKLQKCYGVVFFTIKLVLLR